MDLSILQRKFKLEHSKEKAQSYYIRNLQRLKPDGYTIDEICEYIRSLDGCNESSKGKVANAFLRQIRPALGNEWKFNLEVQYVITEVFREFTDNIVSEPKVDRSMIPSLEEVQKLIAETEPRTSVLIAFLYHVPLRVAELCDLRLNQIKRVEDSFGPHYLIDTIQKGGRRHKPIAPIELIDSVRKIYNSRVLLFETKNHTRIFPQNLYRTIKREGERVLGRHLWPHLFRHIFATHLMQKGVNPSFIAKQLGHDLRTMEKHYEHSYIDPAIFKELAG